MSKHQFAFGVCVAAAVSAAVSARAGLTNVMKNVTNASVTYTTLSNWELSDGTALTEAPTNSTDDVLFKDIGDETSPQWQTLQAGIASSFNIASLSGDPRRTLQYGVHNSDYLATPEIRLGIGDLSGWRGIFSACEWNAGFSLADGQVMPSLIPYSRVPITVPANAEARVDSFYGDGTVRVDGSGKLEVGPSINLGNDLNFQVSGSATLEFDGALNESSVEKTFAKAALHLDASREDTITSAKSTKDGHELYWVSKWDDVRGSAVNSAVEESFVSEGGYWIRVARPAFISDVKSPTGLQFVDFGTRPGTYAATNGVPTNCVMKLSKEISGVRAAIMVVRAPLNGSLKSATVLGHDSRYDLTSEGNGLVHSSGLADARFGEAEVDGNRAFIANNYNSSLGTMTGLHVIAMQFRGTGTAKINLLGSDRHYVSRSGGSRLGELLVFTNDLSRAERLAASRYLANKWKGAEADELMDAGSIRIGASAQISVADGKTASVREISATGSSVTKTGGGTLRVGRVVPETASIKVADGAIAFESDARAPATSAPATNSYIWLDAQKAASLVTNDFGSVTNYVTEWKDCRDDSPATNKATSFYTEPPRVPYLVENAWGTRPAVSFGVVGRGNHSWMKFPNWKPSNREAYAAFMVMRPNVTGSTRNFFGCYDNLDFMRNNANLLLATNYYQQDAAGATWSINGRVVNPYADEGAYINQTTNFILLAFRSQQGVQLNGITKDRYDPNQVNYVGNCGNISVGEMIVYNRKLSEREFRDTEAYLMERWGLGTHPDAQTTQNLKSVSFGAGKAALLGGDDDVSIESIECSNGEIVKTGAGTLNTSISDSSAVTVAGGTLELRPNFDAIAIKARWHFDVSDAASRTETTTENSDGSITTNVTQLTDVRKNGLKAVSSLNITGFGYETFVKAHPTLKGVEMPDGEMRTILDFGHHRNTTDTTDVSDSAGMRIQVGTADYQFPGYNAVRESFTVYSDANGSYGQIVGNTGSLNYLRASKALFSLSHVSPYVTNGYMAVDGTVRSPSYSLPAGFHVVSFGTTGNTTANMIVQDRNCNAGGAYFAEQIVFTNALTQVERTHVEKYLMHKWFGDALPLPVPSVTVAAGATFSVGDCQLVSSSISGAGTVVCGELAGIESLAIDGPMEVQGEAAFGDSVAVTVHGGVELKAPGSYPIFTAESYDGLDFASWTLQVDNPVRGRSYSLELKDGAICLRVTAGGAILIVR